jgi:hypothetical protein
MIMGPHFFAQTHCPRRNFQISERPQSWLTKNGHPISQSYRCIVLTRSTLESKHSVSESETLSERDQKP